MLDDSSPCYCAPVTMHFSQFLKNKQGFFFFPTKLLIHVSSAQNALPQILYDGCLSSFRSQFKFHFLKEAFPDQSNVVFPCSLL